MNQASPQAPLHGVAWLVRDPASRTGVRPVTSIDADVRHVDDLPDHLLELHVFPSAEAAGWFARGVEVVGSNSVAITPGVDGMGHILVVARLSDDRPRTDDLEDAVRAVVYGNLTKAQSALRSADEAAFRQAERKASVESWQSVVASVVDVGGLSAETSGAGLRLSGHFGGDTGRHHRIEVEREGDGSLLLQARLDLDGRLRPDRMPSEAAERHQAWLERAVAAAGWQWHAEQRRPVQRVRENDPDALAATLRLIPSLADALRPVIQASEREAEADRLIGCPTRRGVLLSLMRDDTVILARADGHDAVVHGPGQADRRVFRQTLLSMVSEGLLEHLPEEGGGKTRIGISRMGMMAASRDREGLADALMERRAVSRFDGEAVPGSPRPS